MGTGSQAGRHRLKVRHCVRNRELPTGSHARLPCSPISGRKPEVGVGGASGPVSPRAKGLQREKEGLPPGFLAVIPILVQIQALGEKTS